MTEIRNVTVVGAGTMGHSLAQAFAQSGYDVWLNDVNEEILSKAKSLIGSNLKTIVEMGLLPKNQELATLHRIHTTAKIEEAASHADLVIEAIIEDKSAKIALFKALDQICPQRAILASNTSFMDIFKFVETKRPDKVLITHWFAPPHLVPLVEIVRGPQTAQETVDQVKELLIKMGKMPIVISRFLPGFIANRLWSALRNEVLFLLDNGYATAEDIDIAAKASFGLRTPIVGVVKRMDFAGLDVTQKVIRNADFEIAPQMTRSKTLDQLVAQGRMGAKNGKGFYEYGGRSPAEIMKERDIKLIKLKKFLQEVGEL
ncbi:MAG: 3-hydroxyacyl-CoA dehydrogenase family protein [Deltaproteobacteria bacterium]|nr:3-hydroxyacyl-CoA dehydrogenase family protein [Deltaproteobacteria bacterium]